MVLAAVVVVLIGFGDIAMDEAATIGCAYWHDPHAVLEHRPHNREGKTVTPQSPDRMRSAPRGAGDLVKAPNPS
jgi:hypothetical protein